jgi:hypothetical protein
LEVHRNDGWKVPAISADVEVKDRRAKFENIPGVYVTVLKPKEPRTTMMDIWCSRENRGRIEMQELPIRILHLWRFDFEGRVFAYGVSYGNDAIQNGKNIPLGSASAAIYYDVDGSGLFKIRRGAIYPFMPDLIPDWVRTQKR